LHGDWELFQTPTLGSIGTDCGPIFIEPVNGVRGKDGACGYPTSDTYKQPQPLSFLAMGTAGPIFFAPKEPST